MSCISCDLVRCWSGPALLRAVGALLIGLGGPVSASAGDITAFLATGSPGETWRVGAGGALATSWFRIVQLEGEIARLPGEAPESSMTSFTGSALLAPPLGLLTPYGGLGVGVFRQGLGRRRDNGTLQALVLGVKLRAGLLVLKGEYRRCDLSGEPLLPMGHRVSIGAGIGF